MCGLTEFRLVSEPEAAALATYKNARIEWRPNLKARFRSVGVERMLACLPLIRKAILLSFAMLVEGLW